MKYYFSFSTKESFRGRPRTTIVTTLNKDIERAKTMYPEMFRIFLFLRKHSVSLISSNDLESFQKTAMGREQWKNLKNFIYCAAKADTSYSNDML